MSNIIEIYSELQAQTIRELKYRVKQAQERLLLKSGEDERAIVSTDPQSVTRAPTRMSHRGLFAAISGTFVDKDTAG